MASREPMHQFLDLLLFSLDARDAGDLRGTSMLAMNAQDVAEVIDPALIKLAECNLERVREAIDKLWSRAAGGPVRPSRDIDEMDTRACMLDEGEAGAIRARASHDIVTEHLRASDDTETSGDNSRRPLSTLRPCGDEPCPRDGG